MTDHDAGRREDWHRVPVEPTTQMIQAWCSAWSFFSNPPAKDAGQLHGWYTQAYKAMLAAAPTPEPVEGRAERYARSVCHGAGIEPDADWTTLNLSLGDKTPRQLAWETHDGEAYAVMKIADEEIAATLAAERAAHAETYEQLASAILALSKANQALGDAKGRLAASETAGIVEGWRERALKAEAETAETRARCEALEAAQTFQTRYASWMNRVMGDDPTDLAERMHRFTEECLELTQAFGQTRDEADQLVEYVHNQDHIGEPAQEFGGAYGTMVLLAIHTGHDLQACGEAELARVSTPEMVVKIREKRSKRHGRGPLPGIHEPDFIPAAIDPKARETGL